MIEPYITEQALSHILGITHPAALLEQRNISFFGKEGKHRTVRWEDVVLLIQSLLPEGFNALDWLHARLVSGAPLLAARRVEEALNASVKVVSQLVEEGRVVWINRPILIPGPRPKEQVRRMFLPESVVGYAHESKPLDPLQRARTLMMHPSLVEKWCQEHVQCHQPHHGNCSGKERLSFIAAIEPLMTPGYSAMQWHDFRQLDGRGRRLGCTQEVAARILGKPLEWVIERAENHELPGLKLPGLGWRFHEHQVRALQAAA